LTEFVRDRVLFHVTVSKPYKQAFVAGETIDIGANDNPYFQFYEGSREYAVYDNGNMVNVKAVHWLRLVRDGKIAPHPGILPAIALEVAQHDVMLSRELLMEGNDPLSQARDAIARGADPAAVKQSAPPRVFALEQIPVAFMLSVSQETDDVTTLVVSGANTLDADVTL
jgi:hypothetical protein